MDFNSELISTNNKEQFFLTSLDLECSAEYVGFTIMCTFSNKYFFFLFVNSFLPEILLQKTSKTLKELSYKICFYLVL